jgi:hypothetical protein
MIIGLSGKKQSGKTTISNMFFDLLGPFCGVHSFAEPLKYIVLTCFVPSEWNWKMDDFNSEENKRKVTPCGKTVRELLQIIGTDWFRSIYPDVWVNAFKNDLLCSADTHHIVTDVRFPNELRAIQNMGGIVIRTLRHPFEDNHPSETALDEVQEHTMDFDSDDVSNFSVWHNCGSGESLICDVAEYQRGRMFDIVLDNTDMTMEDLQKWCEFMVNELQMSKM